MRLNQIEGHSPVLLLVSLSMLFLGSFQLAMGQDYPHEQITIEQGLVSNTVYTIHADTAGYLWIGTDNGVQRYDGKTWKQYNVSAYPLENEVFEIFEDDYGGLIFSGVFGLHYKYEDDTIREFPENETLRTLCGSEIEAKGLVPNKDFTSARVSTPLDGIVELDSSGYRTIIQPFSNPQLVQSERHSYFTQSHPFKADEKSSELLVKTRHFSGKLTTEALPERRKVFVLDTDTAVFLANQNELYTFANGTYKLRKFDTRVLNVVSTKQYVVATLYNGGISFLTKPELNEGFNFLQKLTVTGFAEDFQGGIWISTLESGVFQVKTLKMQLFHHNSGASERIIALNQIKENVVSTSLYGMAMTLNGTNLLKQQRLFIESSPITAATTFRGDHYAISSQKREITNITQQKAYDFIELNGDKLKGCPEGLLNYSRSRIRAFVSFEQPISVEYALSMDNNRPEGFIEYCIMRDSVVYFTAGNTLNRINYDQSIRLVEDEQRVTYTQYEYYKEHATIATAYDGLRFIQDTTVTPFRAVDGLSSNSIRSICYDPLGYLWVATEVGLDCISPRNKKVVKNWKASDGFSSVKINELLVDSHHVYLGTMDGLTVIHHRETPELTPPIVTLKINKEKISHQQDVYLDYTDSLAGHLEIIDYSTKERNLRYRFGSDSDWIYSNQSEFSSSESAWGDYPLEICYQLKDDSWSSPYVIQLHVSKPWWARIFSVVSFLVLTFLLIRWLILIQKKRITIKLRQENLQNYYKQQLLRSKMDPHFLFNGLNSALYYIESGKINEASDYISKFSSLLRSNLTYSQDDLISIKDELAFIESYYTLESMRLEEHIETELTVAPSLNKQSIYIPSMVVQPLVENAIWHGLGTLNDDKMLAVHFTEKQGKLQIEVKDNGIGIENNVKGQSSKDQRLHASDFIKQRFRLYSQIYGVQFTISYSTYQQDIDRPGTICLIEMPLLRNNRLKTI